MYCPGSSSVARSSSSQPRSSISASSSTIGCCEVVKSDDLTNSVPPQLPHVGSSSAASSDTGKSQSVHRNVPVPATLPDIQAFIGRLLATDSGSSPIRGSKRLQSSLELEAII